MADTYRFRYCRKRPDGKSNETTKRKSFEGWLKEAEPGDEFYVGWCQWVRVTQDGTVVWGNGEELPHVKWVEDVEPTDN